MAFLVCYSQGEVADWRKKAIYLDQRFYELFFEHCFGKTEFPVLRRIISLAYGDETKIDGDQLQELQAELRRASDKFQVDHEQIPALIEIAEHAYSTGVSLAIAGDMYPVLRR